MRFKISKSKYENWQNYEYCEISKGRTKSKFANFWNQILVFHIEKKKSKISQILQFRKSLNFHLQQTHKIIKFLKLLISKISKFSKFYNLYSRIPKISNLMVNYHMCILSVRIIQTIIKIKKINSPIEESNNSTFIILIFEISKSRNIGRSTFGLLILFFKIIRTQDIR